MEIQYHYEVTPFATERTLLRIAQARLKKFLETATRLHTEKAIELMVDESGACKNAEFTAPVIRPDLSRRRNRGRCSA